MTDSDILNKVLISLRRIMRAVDLHSRSLNQRYGLTGPQLIILRELSRLGEISGSELARSVSLSLPTVTGILTRLEKRDLVSRRLLLIEFKEPRARVRRAFLVCNSTAVRSAP